jgi:hypothetical protein
MRRVLLALTLLIFMIAACTPEAAPTGEPSDASEQPASPAAPTETSSEAVPTGPAEEGVIKQLAENLNLQEDEITLVSSEETEFEDACLGVAMEGVMCAQVVTPGRIIVLEANRLEYEYHTSEDGDRIQPATLALIWKREGGIAGFCDTLTVFRSGEVYASKCGSEADGKMGTFASLMTDRELGQFNDWIAELADVTVDASDPKGVADRMVVTLEFFGAGTAEPAESDQQALFEFAQEIYYELAR